MKTESSNYTVRSGLLVELSPSCRLKEIRRTENRESQSSSLSVSLSYRHSPGKKTITGHLYSTLGDITRLQIEGMTLVSKISFFFFGPHSQLIYLKQWCCEAVYKKNSLTVALMPSRLTCIQSTYRWTSRRHQPDWSKKKKILCHISFFMKKQDK